MATQELKNILFVGATGWLGNAVIHAILDKKAFRVKAIIRKDTLTSKKDMVDSLRAKGAEIVEGEVESLADVTDAAKGCDTLVSVLGGATLFGGKEGILVEAAKAAGVKRFVPSQFGIDCAKVGPNTMLDPKNKVAEKIKECGLDYTLILIGMFYEFWWGETTGFDWKNGKVVAVGKGDVRVSTTMVADIARFVPEILLDPYSKNNVIRVAGQSATHNEAIKAFEEVSGKKFEVTYKDAAALQRDLETAAPNVKYIPILQLFTLNKNEAANFEHTDNARYPNVKPVTIKEYAAKMYGK